MSSSQMNFHKLQATGNDFIVLDNRQNTLPHSDWQLWERLCRRQLGIGADGVLFLENSATHDFHMRYLNSDGRPAAMCGNGARAITLYAHQILKLKSDPQYYFTTASGEYTAHVASGQIVKIMMGGFIDHNRYQIDDLSSYHSAIKEQFYLNTGVEHLVLPVDEVDAIDLERLAPSLRSHPQLPNGANINLVQQLGANQLKMRTFEKGVEGETLSCGTGAVATAIATQSFYQASDPSIKISTRGGEVEITPAADGNSALFSGEVEIVYAATTT